MADTLPMVRNETVKVRVCPVDFNAPKPENGMPMFLLMKVDFNSYIVGQHSGQRLHAVYLPVSEPLPCMTAQDLIDEYNAKMGIS